MFNPQMTSSQMELLPLVCLCLLSWSGTTSADVTVVVAEGGDAILKCSFDGVNMETGVFEWKKDGQMKVFLYKAGSHYNNGLTGQDEQFKGRVSHFHKELKDGNASIRIRNAKMADSGNYTCKFPNNHPSPTFNVKLVVGAPKPSITILRQTETSALLQCEAPSVPDLQVHWQDSDGNILPAEEPQVTERGGRKYITVNTTVNKRGNFYCVATQKNINHTISAERFVRLPVTVKEGDDAVLPCSIDGVNMETGVFDWKKDGQTEVFQYDKGSHYNNGRPGQDQQFKGRVSYFHEDLKHGNASIKITNAKTADSGNYTCEFPNLQPPQTFYIQLVVEPVLKQITVTARKPFVTILHQTDDWALLQCEAHGSPDLEVHWQDSDGRNLTAEKSQVTEGGGILYITVKTTVNKTGNFSCVATQKNISHRISGIYVYIHDNTGIIIGFVIALVVVAVVVVAVVGVGMFCWQKRKQKELQEKNQIIDEANQMMKKMDEELQTLVKSIDDLKKKLSTSERQEKNQIIDEANQQTKTGEGSSDPAENMPLKPVNSSP